MRALITFLLSASVAVAAEPSLETVKIGKHVMGKAVSKDDMKGKVVLVEEWGINCGPCIASMPHLAMWHEEMADYGLIVVGLHRQNASDSEVKSRCEALGVRFPIFQGGQIGGKSSGGIPHCAVIGHDGVSVFEGSPRNVEASLRKAVGAMLVAEIDKPTKAMEPITSAIKNGGSPLDALKKIIAIQNNGEKATMQQAKTLSNRILEGGRTKLAEVKTMMKEDPISAYDSSVMLAARWKGFDTGTKAAEIVNKLKLDRTVTAELKARPSLDGIKKLDIALTQIADSAEMGTDVFRKKFAVPIKDMKKSYDTMKRQFPDARSTKEAALIVEKYDLPTGNAK